ncbi:MAG: tetratricopeptide repeat protein [Bacteroidales bacterium]|nr:tetratricopeptide repeat protein [Bacteroidales bacterium]
MIQRIFCLLLGTTLLLTSCTFRSKAKTERMAAVVNEVRDKYRADEDISQNDEIFEAYDYFVKTKDYENAAPAALYSGRVRQAKKEYEAAMNCYQEADRYGRMAGDSVSAAYAQYYIGDLLNASGHEEDAIANYQAAAELWGDSLSRKAKCLNAVAMMNIVIDKYDSAFVYLEKALKLAQASEDNITEASVWNNYSVAYQLLDKNDAALDCLRKTLPLMDEKRRPIALLNLAKVYLALDERDSLEYYKSQMLNAIETVECKPETMAAVCGFLIKDALNHGDYATAFELEKQHEQVALDILSDQTQSSVLEIQKKYDFEAQANQHNRQMLSRQRLIILLTVVLIAALVIMTILILNALKKKKIEADINANLLELKKRNAQQLQEQSALKTQLDALQQQTDDKLKDEYLQKCHIIRCFEVYSHDRNNTMSFKDLEKALFEGEDHWASFEQAFEGVHPGFIDSIKQNYPDLNDSEFRYCLLSHFKLSRQEYADVLGCSVYNIDKIRASLNNKMKENA